MSSRHPISHSFGYIWTMNSGPNNKREVGRAADKVSEGRDEEGKQEVDWERKRKVVRKSSSAINSPADFQAAFPSCSLDWNTLYEVQVTSVVGQGVLYEMVNALVVQLIMCDRSLRIDNESSKYPFVHEILKNMVRYCDARYTLKNVEVESLDTELLVEEFVLKTMDKIVYETQADTILRWERHVRSARGPSGALGFVEFRVEFQQQVKLLVDVKKHMGMSNNSLTSCEGFYQACGQLALAHQQNIATAVSQCEQDFRLREARLHEEQNRKGAGVTHNHVSAERAEALLAEKETARHQAASQPVYLALTDFSNWVFLKLHNNTITASRFITPFPTCAQQISGSPDVLTLLQYLCDSLSIQPRDCAAFHDTANLLRQQDTALAHQVVLEVHQDAVDFVENLSYAHMPSEQIKELFAKKYPNSDALYDLICNICGLRV